MKNILLATIGASPQVLTETLYTLCREDGHTAIDIVIDATGILVGRIIRRNTAITAVHPSKHGEKNEYAINS